MVAAAPLNEELVLVVDRGREGREAQQLQRAELGQQVQRDQQRAAEQRRAQLRQHHPDERAPAPEPERVRRLLQRRGRARAAPPRPAGRPAGSTRASRSASAPAKPSTPGVSDTQPKLLTNAGHGERRHQQDRATRARPGRSVRSTSQAAPTPMHQAERDAADGQPRRCSRAGSAMRGRTTSRSHASAQPVLDGVRTRRSPAGPARAARRGAAQHAGSAGGRAACAPAARARRYLRGG